jgi:glycosyltransferase involved in cell wall biosynthesis
MNTGPFVTPNFNIVFVGESYLGGMAGSKRLQNIINALLKTGNSNIANLIIHNPNEPFPEKTTGDKNGVRYRILNYKIKNPFSVLAFYQKAFKFVNSSKSEKLKNILYCYDTPTFINYPVLRYARRKGYKVLVDIVEDYALGEQNMSLPQKFMHSRQVKLLQKVTEYANGALVISKYLNDKLVREVAGRIPVFHLPITVDFSYFASGSVKKASHCKIFYGGSFGEKDGLTYLLKAFEKVAAAHRTAELVLTGKPPRAGMEAVLEFIGKSEYRDRIKFLGYLNDGDYYDLMNSSDIFCMTRVNSSYAGAGFPFKLGEMLATGKPVIATNVSNVSDYLTDMQNALLIKPDSVESISEAILYLINHQDVAAKIGDAGRKTALRFFDTDAHVKALEQFLLKI